MTEHDLSRAAWHTSSYSSQDGNCVEVVLNLPGVVAIRDSKDPDGAVLVVAREEWQTFLVRAKAEMFQVEGIHRSDYPGGS